MHMLQKTITFVLKDNKRKKKTDKKTKTKHNDKSIVWHMYVMEMDKKKREGEREEKEGCYQNF